MIKQSREDIIGEVWGLLGTSGWGKPACDLLFPTVASMAFYFYYRGVGYGPVKAAKKARKDFIKARPEMTPPV